MTANLSAPHMTRSAASRRSRQALGGWSSGKPAWDRDRVEAKIREWTTRYGEPPAFNDWHPAGARRRGEHWRLDRWAAGVWPSAKTVQLLYGSFSLAVVAAGYEPRSKGWRARAAHVDPDRIKLLATLEPNMIGPGPLAARFRAVADAHKRGERDALAGALMDLSIAAAAWSQRLEDTAEASA